MLNQILRFLLDTVFGFFVFVLLVRFYLQLMRAPFRNPLGQFVTALTNWLVLPARRLIPGMFGLDLASFLLAWLIEALLVFLLYVLRGGSPGAASGVVTTSVCCSAAPGPVNIVLVVTIRGPASSPARSARVHVLMSAIPSSVVHMSRTPVTPLAR